MTIGSNFFVLFLVHYFLFTLYPRITEEIFYVNGKKKIFIESSKRQTLSNVLPFVVLHDRYIVTINVSVPQLS